MTQLQMQPRMTAPTPGAVSVGEFVVIVAAILIAVALGLAFGLASPSVLQCPA